MTRLLRRWWRVARARVRSWRLALGVLVVGGLVGPAATLALTGSPERAAFVSVGVVIYGGFVAALLLGSGGWGSDVRSGVAILWLQKPADPALVQLHRLVPRLVLVVATVGLLTGLAVAVSGVHGKALTPEQLLQAGATTMVTCVVFVCVTWAISCWMMPVEGILAAAAFLALLGLALAVAESPETFGSVLPLAEAAALPADQIQRLSWALAGTGWTERSDLARVAAWTGSWVALGAIGILVTSRSPRAGPSD